MPPKNFCFGTSGPLDHQEAIEQIFRNANRYYNQRVEIDRTYRTELKAARCRLDPNYAQACVVVDEAEAAVETHEEMRKLRNQRARRTIPATEEEQAEYARLKNARTAAWTAHNAALSRVNRTPEMRETRRRLDAAKTVSQKRARNQCNVYWGSYKAVEDACDTAEKMTMPWKLVKWKRFDGTGTLSVQISGGISIQQLLSCTDTKVRLELGEDNTATLWLRIDSESRRPVWAHFPVELHRPLPETGQISYVFVHKTKCASDVRWKVRFTIDIPYEPRVAPDKLVAVHVGWRKMPDGSLRVATWRGSDGRCGTVVFSERRFNYALLPDRIQAERDVRFNTARDRLAQWIDAATNRANRGEPGPVIPAWLREHRQHMLRWKSQQRLAGVMLYWRNNRFAGDETVFRLLHGQQHVPNRGWRKRDKRQWLWFRYQKRNVTNWRKDTYRKLAHQLAQEYGRVCCVRAPWAQMRKKRGIDQTEAQTPAMRQASALAAVATLETCLAEAFGEDCVVPIDIHHLTKDCHHCGSRQDVDGTLREHTCSGCGQRWDIDLNAVHNQLTRMQAAVQELPDLSTVMQLRVSQNGQPKPLSQRQRARIAGRETLRRRREEAELA